MGFISDPERRLVFTNFVLRYTVLLSLISYILSFFAVVVLFHPELREKNYFSENALLPGEVNSLFNGNELRPSIVEQELRDLGNVKRFMPRDYIESKLLQYGIEVYRQNFTVNTLSQMSLNGENVYGIIRAPRANGDECLVLVIPHTDDTVYSSYSIALSLAAAFKSGVYWAKDVIFLFSDVGLEGTQAWLQAYHYHYSRSNVIVTEPLAARSGSIQAALSLELSSLTADGIDIFLEGMNGHLPNLDFFNVAVKVIKQHDGKPYIHGRPDPPKNNLYDNSLHMMKTVFKGFWTQASSKPFSHHALFLPFHIDAVTFKSVQGRSMKPIHIGRAIEATLRSLNSLEERFHQSFFFYFTPNSYNYISIGLYFPAHVLALASIAPPILWLYSKSFIEEVPANPTLGVLRLGTLASPMPFLVIMLISHSIGISLYFFVSSGSYLDIFAFLSLDCESSLLLAIMCVYLISVCIPVMNILPYFQTNEQRAMSKYLCNGWVSIVLLTLSLSNFSLAFMITLVFVPVVNCSIPIVSQTYSKWITCFQRTLVFLVSPVVFLSLILSIDFMLKDIPFTFERFFATWQIIVNEAVAEDAKYGAYMFPLTSCVLFPMWLINWYTLFL